MPNTMSNALLGFLFPFNPSNTFQIDILLFQFTKTFKVRRDTKFPQGHPADPGPGYQTLKPMLLTITLHCLPNTKSVLTLSKMSLEIICFSDSVLSSHYEILS